MSLLLSLALLACTDPGHDKPGPVDTDGPPDTDVTDTDDSGDDSGGGPVVSEGLAGLADLGVRNVVFVHVDTLRADRLPFYGAARNTLPNVSDRPWLVVDGLYAQASWTIPSSVSVLTAQEAHRHGVTHMTASGSFNTELLGGTVVQAFSEAGYATLALSGNESLPQVVGLFDDFDVFDGRYIDGYSHDLSWIGRNALGWLDTIDPATPFFIYLQPMDVHGPYDPEAPYLGTYSDPETLPIALDADEDEQLRQLQEAYAAAATDEERAALTSAMFDVYDEGILGLDAALDRLLTGLAERGHDRDTLIVFTADHGETIMDELDAPDLAFFGHGGKVRQELVHVPLLFHHPALPPAKVRCLAENTDTLPTVLRALGLDVPATADGRPLQDGCREVARTAVFFNDIDERLLSELMVTTGESTLRWGCLNGRAYGYDLLSDAAGVVDVETSDLPQGAWLEGQAQAYVDEIGAALGTPGCTITE